MPNDWPTLVSWVVLCAVLVAVAIVIGGLAARFFLRATRTRADRR